MHEKHFNHLTDFRSHMTAMQRCSMFFFRFDSISLVRSIELMATQLNRMEKFIAFFVCCCFANKMNGKKNLCEINKQIYHQRFVNVIIVSCGIGWNAYVIHRYYGIGKLPKR